MLGGKNSDIFLHAVTDIKIVYRISTKYGGLPLFKMNVTCKTANSAKRIKTKVSTTGAQKSLRMNLGFNDQSDAKRSAIGLSSKYFKYWPQHLTGKTIEDTIINAYGNYLLDPSCSIES